MLLLVQIKLESRSFQAIFGINFLLKDHTDQVFFEQYIVQFFKFTVFKFHLSFPK